jgi:predicted metal-dependent phosphoesterase TrpH
MKADLHCHTLLSDGTLGIEEIISVARKSGVNTIAVTDHDTLAGTVRAQIIGKRFNVDVVPGVELSCWDEEHSKKVHLLCYLPDNPDRLEGLCRRTSIARKRAGQMMLIKAAAHFPLTADYVIKCATGSTNIYKQHIMRALMNIGYADTMFGDMWNELFVEPGENNISVAIKYPDVYEVLEEILGAGGIPVLAHPAHYDNWDILDDLVKAGLCGVEVYHPSHSQEDVEKLLAFAKKNKLLVTGGSDFHGCNSPYGTKMGDYLTPEADLSSLLNFKARRKRAKRREEKLAAAKAVE